jgi:hypothetical protein
MVIQKGSVYCYRRASGCSILKVVPGLIYKAGMVIQTHCFKMKIASRMLQFHVFSFQLIHFSKVVRIDVSKPEWLFKAFT